MLRKCSKKGCEFEIDYICECLSLQTYWCQFHLGEHLKLSNRTHAFDTIIGEPSQEINDSIFDFLEKEKSKIEKLKEIALAYLSSNLYNSKISIEETFKKLDNYLKEINGLIKKTTKSLKKIKDSNIKELNNSELYMSRLCFILNQLRTKRSKILGNSNNEPSAEKDYRKTCYLYENSSSDPSLYQAYHEYVETHDKLTSLYLIEQNDKNTANLYVYNTESESEKIKVLEIKKNHDKKSCITQLPNGELFYCNTTEKAFIIDRNYKLRRLPSWKANDCTFAIYFNRSVYCFGIDDANFRFELEKNIWVQLSSTMKDYRYCNIVIFNRNILITLFQSSNILLYSIDIDSFSEIPRNGKNLVSKILIKGEKRLYLIECEGGSIFESDVDDEYTWNWIARSTIDLRYTDQVYCSYNKGGIYISIYSYFGWHSRQYFKFDLDQKSLTELAFHNKDSNIKRSSSNHRYIECYNKTFLFISDDATVYINKGNSLFNLGFLLDEIQLIYKAPSNDADYKRKGDALLELGRKLEAIVCFNQAIKFNPNNTYFYSKKAEILCENGREAEAINCCNEAIKNNPCYDAYISKGYTLCKFKRYIEAIEICDQETRLDSLAFGAYLCKGEALYSLDRKNEAIECYNKAIRVNRNRNAYFYKAKILSELDRDFEVIECCNEAIKNNKNDERFYMLKGTALSKMGKNSKKIKYYEKLIDLFNEKIEKNPYKVKAYITKGIFLYYLDRKIEAIQCYNKLFKIDPKNKIKYVKNILDLPNYNKLFETRIEKAKVGTMNKEDLHFLDWIIEFIERYSEEIEMKTHYAYAYMLKGCTLHLAGKYLEEIECYDKAIAINPDDENIYVAKDDAMNKVET